MSDSGSAVRQFPDRDLIDLAYVRALDAMSASENYETMTRVDRSSPATARAFASATRDVHETMAAASFAVHIPAPDALRTRIFDALDSASQQSTVTSLADKRASRSRLRAIAAAAAAVVVLAVGGAVVGNQLTGPNSTEQVQAGGFRSVPAVGGGTVSVAHTPGADTATVRLDGLASPGDGNVYQMWLINGSLTSAGLVDSGALGSDRTIDSVGSATAVAVTVEPAGGSVTPTSDVIAEVPINA